MPNPSEIIGPAAVKALTDAGYTLTPPKEPARIVTGSETMDRFKRFIHGSREWDVEGDIKVPVLNAADDWLVKTVNRRIIGALSPAPFDPSLVVTGERKYNAKRDDLLLLFCGEGA